VRIGPYSFEEYIHLVKSFHGNIAPGMIIGGFMVDKALGNTPAGELFDAICETPSCLPDAVQLLTPCTIGNGWLRVLNLGRYAVTLYEKYGGEGIRVYIDSSKLDAWPAIKEWLFKLKPKKLQNSKVLFEQIRNAGFELCGIQNVRVHSRFLEKRSKGSISICPICGEAYPLKDGNICRACDNEKPYTEIIPSQANDKNEMPELATIQIEESIGYSILHDMTRIVPGKEKGAAFKSGHVVTKNDIEPLLKMGKKKLYSHGANFPGAEWVHEDEAAILFARVMAGDGVFFTDTPSEGKVTLLAERDGLFVVDEEQLHNFNAVPNVMCASRQSYSIVSREDRLAGTRAIPLYLARDTLKKALAVLKGKPVFKILPMRQAQVGILVTGTEVYEGLVEDRFIPMLCSKLNKLNCIDIESTIVPDDRTAIRDAARNLIDHGIDLLITTAGLSVDPDDVTRKGLEDAGATDMLHGAPVLPGAMTLLAHIGNVQVIGVPAGALYFTTTSFDLLVPRLLAGLTISRQDLISLGSGGFCLECPTCTFPQCPFGR
jgi:formylmethanofuran dehydrogenase subunit E